MTKQSHEYIKENFYTLYLDFKDLYEKSKDAALVKKDLQIEKGMDVYLADLEYKECIKRLEIQLKTIDSFMYYIIQNLGANHSYNIDEYFRKNIIKIYSIQIKDL